MKRLLSLTALLLLVGVAGFAQKANKAFVGTLNDFAGNWALDKKLSKFPPRDTRDITNYTAHIELDADTFRLSKDYEEPRGHCKFDYVFELSGKGEANKITGCFSSHSETLKSKTTVENNVVTRRYSTPSTIGWLDVTETYRLVGSADTLVIEISDGLLTQVYTFHRVH